MSERERWTATEFAIWVYQLSGKIDDLVWVLRSPIHALTLSDRNLIANYLEGKIKLPRGRPPLAPLMDHKRTRLLPIRAAAFEADRLKSEWRENGPPEGVRK